MRNLKKFLALVLATLMLLSVAVISTSAADKADYTEAANQLAALQVMKGNENGDLMLENGVTRYQAALFFVQTLTGETDVATWNAEKKSASFTDVVEYGTAIDYANGIGIVKGRGNGVFGYNDAITYQDMLVMAVRALGYETADMSYPYGYILAAQKLGLTDNVDLVNYKAALTRGETAQVIWDMLNTQVAVVDPLTDKVYYPESSKTTPEGEEEGFWTENSLGKFMAREELIVDSGLAGDKITVVVDKFVAADEEDEESFDTVEISNGLVLAAADLGITADTTAVSYVGLPVDLFISVDADDFNQTNYDEGDAKVVFASFPEYTVVQNLSGDGDIKYVENEDETKNYISIGGVKFTDEKYDLVVKEFNDEDGTWEDSAADVKAIFTYDAKDGYTTEGVNTYGEVAYRVSKEATKTDKGEVEILYTAYDFGQYNVREINDVKYTVVATYEARTNGYINLDEVETKFVEYLVDGAQKITVDTKKVSNSKGEAASTVKVEGEAVEAGDFMFYNYNAADNILTVAMNAGKLETGRLTSQRSKDETVKIGDKYYGFGFAGAFTADFVAEYNEDVAKGYMAVLEAGKDNVEFLVVDGKIVYMVAADVTSTNSTFDYAIISDDTAIMADLLEMSEEKYISTLEDTTTGYYVEDGDVKVAMLNLTTGEWELVTIASIAYAWNEDEGEFDKEYDVANAVDKTEIMGESAPSKYTEAVEALDALVGQALVAVVAEEDGVYTIADTYYTTYVTVTVEGDNPETEDVVEESYETEVPVDVSFFVFGATDDGILFSDTSAKTNAITADNDIAEERVTLDEESIIVVIDSESNVGTRVGVQSEANSFEVEAGYFLAASSDLIVLVETEKVMVDIEDDPETEEDETATVPAYDVLDWADAATANSDENWYIVTVDTEVEIERSENEDEETYVITYTNLFDMKAQAVVETLVTEVTKAKRDDAINVVAGDLLKKLATDEIVIDGTDFATVLEEVANDNEDKLEYTGVAGAVIDFQNADTVVIPGVVGVNTAVDVNMTVVTINLSDLDLADYDLNGAIADEEYVENEEDPRADVEVQWGTETVVITPDDPETEDVDETETEVRPVYINAWEYIVNLELVDEINEPTEGVYDAYATGAFIAPSVESDDYLDGAVFEFDVYTAYTYEDGVVNAVVYRFLNGIAISDIPVEE